jgi:methionyl aminopeptidase
MVEDVDRWRRAGRIGAEARELGAGLLVPGASRREVAEEVERFIRSQGALPAFPANLSTNQEAAHYTPDPEDDYRFRTGDLVKLDVGAHLDGAISDTAVTVEVGSDRHAGLRRAVRSAQESAGRLLKGDVETRELSLAIERAIRGEGYRPVENLTGHTIEPYLLHAGTSIPNVAGFSSQRLGAGQVVAIEPFATGGAGRIRNGPFGNILRFREPPDGERTPELAEVFQRFRTLPFCLRWVEEGPMRRTLLKERRRLQTYPVFVEVREGLVAQWERTFLITPEGSECLTP